MYRQQNFLGNLKSWLAALIKNASSILDQNSWSFLTISIEFELFCENIIETDGNCAKFAIFNRINAKKFGHLFQHPFTSFSQVPWCVNRYCSTNTNKEFFMGEWYRPLLQ